MPGFLAPIGGWIAKNALGLLGAAGGFVSNRSARAAADRSMAFSERMSSTAAQRSVKDYAEAGLNPALAYDRPASSPGGSVAQVEDAVGKGISSGMQARAMKEQLELVKQQVRKTENEADVAAGQKVITEAQSAPWQTRGEGSLQDEFVKSERARLQFQYKAQPHQLNQLKALSELSGAQVPGAQAEAELWRKLDQLGPMMKGLLPLLRLIKPR